jgi:hypothetical protein
MKAFGITCLIAFAALASAQVPDVTIKLDAKLNYRTGPADPNTQRLYDSLGHYSIVSLSFKLEPGFRVYVGQKLQRFDGGRDPDLLDEYYIEDEGIWRVGKQYVPFGAGRLIRESVLAARGDSNLIFEGLPIAAAYCQGDAGRQEGLVGRVGGRLGFSVFYGDHFGIEGTSLDYIQKPDEAKGRHHGYKQAYAVDYSRGVGNFNLGLEVVALRHPNGDDDEFEVGDLSATYTPSKYQTYVVGWTRRTRPTKDFWRVQASVFLTRNVFLEPMIRYKNGSIYDFNLGVRVRL